MTRWGVREVEFDPKREICSFIVPTGTVFEGVFTGARAAVKIGVVIRFPLLDAPQEWHSLRFVSSQASDAVEKMAYDDTREEYLGFADFGSILTYRIHVFHKLID